MPEASYAARKEAEAAYELYDENAPAEDEAFDDYDDDFAEYGDDYDDFEDFSEPAPIEYDEPVYGKHNPSKYSSADEEDEGFVDGNVEEITNFSLDISDFK